MKPFAPQDDASEGPDFLEKGKGLYGGAGNMRRDRGHVSRLEHALLLDPFGDADARAQIDAFLRGPEPLEIEIGFGHGVFFFAHADAVRDRRLLGFEVKGRDCALLMNRLAERGDAHARVIQADARPLFDSLLAPEQVTRIHINFPDPWWKKRHHKRRVFSSNFISLMHSRLTPGGCVAVRTDVADYAHLIEELIAQHGGFKQSPLASGSLAPTWREKRCTAYGLPVHGMLFEKRQPAKEDEPS
jgi:tRNA (guanine-N7-)-methyltransferase